MVPEGVGIFCRSEWKSGVGNGQGRELESGWNGMKEWKIANLVTLWCNY